MSQNFRLKMSKFIDIGANLTDLMYSGIYNGSTKHQPDLKEVLKRSWECGLSKIIITGGSLSESKAALDLAQTDDRLYCTVGCHPTRCNEFEEKADPTTYLQNLKSLILDAKSKIVAIGECGLDYDRLQFCPKEIQKKYFEQQLILCKDLNMPLFLHCRNAAEDLRDILGKFQDLKGVVHSFDGTLEEANKFIEMGFYIGLNGCSLKTVENLETVKSLPSDKILLETDCPWCEVRPTHPGYKYISPDNVLPNVKKEKWTSDKAVKGRNEPANIRQILDVVAHTRNEDANNLCDTIYQNTLTLFFNKETSGV